MTDVLILIRVRSHMLNESSFRQYHQDVCDCLRTVKGFLASSLLQHRDEPELHLVLFHYQDQAAAEAGLLAISEQGILLPNAQIVGGDPADVIRLSLVEHLGSRPLRLDDSEYISVSIRVADPGFGSELIQELSGIFQDLTYIEGFAGASIGVNDTLAEEVVGLVAWKTEIAYEASLPMRMPYEVALYHRISSNCR